MFFFSECCHYGDLLNYFMYVYFYRLFSIDKNALFSEMVVTKNAYKSAKLNKSSEELIKNHWKRYLSKFVHII